MSEYKIGDRVMCRGIEGMVTGQRGRLYEVRLGGQGYYLYANQMEPLKTAKVCMYCKHGEPLNDTSNSNFALVIRQGESSYYLESEYDPGEWNDNDWGNINYCPKCGRKLEVAE